MANLSAPWYAGSAPITQGYRPGFGLEPQHTGIDLGLPLGTSIFAALSGWLDELTNPGGFGTYEILHPDSMPGAEIILGHESAYVGGPRHVHAGELIGYSGSTGWSTGPHLHFQENIDAPARGYGGHDVDPSQLLKTGEGGGTFDLGSAIANNPAVEAVTGPAGALAGGLSGIGFGIASLPDAFFKGMAAFVSNATSGVEHAISTQVVALSVAAVVLLILFG